MAVALIAFAGVVRADPLLALAGCSASSPQEARSLGDALLRNGAYQQAGECYRVAGKFDLANQAFLKAVRPQTESSAHQLAENRDEAKAQLRTVRQAFHGIR